MDELGLDGEPETMEAVLKQVVEATVGTPAATLQGTTNELRPSPTTSNPTNLGTNVLHDMDQAAQVGWGLCGHVAMLAACLK